MSKVSVIIPVYGVEKYIEKCARSLFEQSLDDIEYLFIDDCTPDKSIEILHRVLEDYPFRKPQVVVHRMDRNSGQAIVRQWGMEHAKGDYVIHCDSDDWVDTEMYKSMYFKAIDENADVVICDIYKSTLENDMVQCGCHSENINGFVKNCLFQKDSWSLCNKLFKRTVCYNRIDYPTSALGEDMYIFFQLIQKCQKLTYVPIPFYYYRYNASSITKKFTVSNCLYKYTTLKDNTDKLIVFLETKYASQRYLKEAKDFLRINNARCLMNILYLSDYRKIWNDTCKDVSLIRLLFCPHIGIYHKVVYFLTKFGFLPRKEDRAENI